MPSATLRTLILLVALAMLGSCRSTSATVTAGRDGVFRTTITTNEQAIVVEGIAGRLIINGSDRGAVARGDVVRVSIDGEVRVNGTVR